MHELAVTRNIVAIVAEQAQGRRVRRVRLEIGKLSGVMADAVRFCFDAVAQGTVLEGARLEIDEPSGRARCRACGDVFEQDTIFTPCTCAARDYEPLGGEELTVLECEVDDDIEASVA
jgi:hydrogenase nickel incorporation protein HypA/HybF